MSHLCAYWAVRRGEQGLGSALWAWGQPPLQSSAACTPVSSVVSAGVAGACTSKAVAASDQLVPALRDNCGEATCTPQEAAQIWSHSHFWPHPLQRLPRVVVLRHRRFPCPAWRAGHKRVCKARGAARQVETRRSGRTEQPIVASAH